MDFQSEDSDKENTVRGKDLFTLKRKHSTLANYISESPNIKNDRLILTPVGKKATKEGTVATPPTLVSPGRRKSSRIQQIQLRKAIEREIDEDLNSTDQSSQVETDYEDEDEDIQECFFNQKISKSATSNKTLQFHKSTNFHLLKESNHMKYFKELGRKHIEGFPQFKFELSQGFNLLFYGFGSKISLVQQFVDTCHYSAIYIKAFKGSLKFDSFLYEIYTLFGLRGKITMENIKNQIGNHVFILVIYNFELLQCELSFYSFIKDLNESGNLQLVCTVDHLNSFLKVHSIGNFIAHDLTNFIPYFVETIHESSLMKETVNVNGIKYLMKSIGPNSKKLFILLIKNQVKEQDGISSELFFRRCREAFLVDNLVTFKTLLVEFL